MEYNGFWRPPLLGPMPDGPCTAAPVYHAAAPCTLCWQHSNGLYGHSGACCLSGTGSGSRIIPWAPPATNHANTYLHIQRRHSVHLHIARPPSPFQIESHTPWSIMVSGGPRCWGPCQMDLVPQPLCTMLQPPVRCAGNTQTVYMGTVVRAAYLVLAVAPEASPETSALQLSQAPSCAGCDMCCSSALRSGTLLRRPGLAALCPLVLLHSHPVAFSLCAHILRCSHSNAHIPQDMHCEVHIEHYRAAAIM